MLLSIAKATALLGLVPSATSWALPGTSNDNYAPSSPEVPWKAKGLYSATKRNDDGYSSGCNHGPAARSCWKDNYNVDTDMDLEWPETGKTVKVSYRSNMIANCLC